MWGSPLRDRWRGGRDQRQARFLTLASLRWVIRHRAYTPWYLVRYAPLLGFRLAHPPVPRALPPPAALPAPHPPRRAAGHGVPRQAGRAAPPPRLRPPRDRPV